MLEQRLRRWPALNQHLVSVPFWLGKLTWELALNEAMGMKRI